MNEADILYLGLSSYFYMEKSEGGTECFCPQNGVKEDYVVQVQHAAPVTPS
jgi:hypothetical protein